MTLLTTPTRFQFTPLRTRRPYAEKIIVVQFKFQSTLPQGERPHPIIQSEKLGLFQSTLPRGRRHLAINRQIVGFLVSIHASAKEATTVTRRVECGMEVSIHASAREATRIERDDRTTDGVSIHASAREATWGKCSMLAERPLFQSTPPRRRRPTGISQISSGPKFQSTPPRGRRLMAVVIFPRALTVSIHASAREATVSCGTHPETSALFQSTPPRGRRLAGHQPFQRDVIVSIHASAREATRPAP